MKQIQIAIDGPASSGKSTVAKITAKGRIPYAPAGSRWQPLAAAKKKLATCQNKA